MNFMCAYLKCGILLMIGQVNFPWRDDHPDRSVLRFQQSPWN